MYLYEELTYNQILDNEDIDPDAPETLYALAQCFRTGRGVTADEKRYRALLHDAAAAGSEMALEELNQSEQPAPAAASTAQPAASVDLKTAALRDLETLTKSGNLAACLELYHRSLDAKSQEMCDKYMQRAIALSQQSGQDIGLCQQVWLDQALRTKGTDPEASRKALENAQELGSKTATVRLLEYYEKGIGGPSRAEDIKDCLNRIKRTGKPSDCYKVAMHLLKNQGDRLQVMELLEQVRDRAQDFPQCAAAKLRLRTLDAKRYELTTDELAQILEEVYNKRQYQLLAPLADYYLSKPVPEHAADGLYRLAMVAGIDTANGQYYLQKAVEQGSEEAKAHLAEVQRQQDEAKAAQRKEEEIAKRQQREEQQRQQAEVARRESVHQQTEWEQARAAIADTNRLIELSRAGNLSASLFAAQTALRVQDWQRAREYLQPCVEALDKGRIYHQPLRCQIWQARAALTDPNSKNYRVCLLHAFAEGEFGVEPELLRLYEQADDPLWNNREEVDAFRTFADRVLQQGSVEDACRVAVIYCTKLDKVRGVAAYESVLTRDGLEETQRLMVKLALCTLDDARYPAASVLREACVEMSQFPTPALMDKILSANSQAQPSAQLNGEELWQLAGLCNGKLADYRTRLVDAAAAADQPEARQEQARILAQERAEAERTAEAERAAAEGDAAKQRGDLQAAAEAGDVKALCAVGDRVEKTDPKRAKTCWERAAQKGNGPCCLRLARLGWQEKRWQYAGNMALNAKKLGGLTEKESREASELATNAQLEFERAQAVDNFAQDTNKYLSVQYLLVGIGLLCAMLSYPVQMLTQLSITLNSIIYLVVAVLSCRGAFRWNWLSKNRPNLSKRELEMLRKSVQPSFYTQVALLGAIGVAMSLADRDVSDLLAVFVGVGFLIALMTALRNWIANNNVQGLVSDAIHFCTGGRGLQ